MIQIISSSYGSNTLAQIETKFMKVNSQRRTSLHLKYEFRDSERKEFT